jgi:uroporphyrin-III C-methyltransferase
MQEPPTQPRTDGGDPASDEPPVTGDPKPGKVYLVGSGPGDPDLLTVRALRLLESADVVLHDKLPGPDIIDLIPDESGEDVGKRAGGERTPQSDTNRRLVEHAREGRSVVRLKGGDPFLFGRGGEEMQYLVDAGVPFEIVPGVTSAIGGPGIAGIPVTHRDHASTVSFVTGHEDPAKDESSVDWEALAATGGTIVVLMGVGKLPEYTAALREAGLSADTPVAMIERASWPTMRVATGTLGSIVDVRDTNEIEPPAITVIGEVAGARESVLSFLESEQAAPISEIQRPEPDDTVQTVGAGPDAGMESGSAADSDVEPLRSDAQPHAETGDSVDDGDGSTSSPESDADEEGQTSDDETSDEP